jgi:transcriptional regulator with XRE-family HTH domain
LQALSVNLVNFVNRAQNRGVYLNMFYKEFLRLCGEAGQTPTGAAKAMGYAGANVNKWKNGSMPTDVTLLKIAKYFGLPENYFDSFKGKKEKSPTPEGAGLIPGYEDLSDENKAKARDFIAFLLSQQ